MPDSGPSPAQDLFPDERAALILERLRAHGRVWASGLALELNTSEHTIRRHLGNLAAAGLCKRVYGGALLLSTASGTHAARMIQAPDRKAQLARTAVSIVQAGSILLIDAGSTNSAIASALPEHLDLTVVTNAPDICAGLCGRPGFQVLQLGGRVSRAHGGAVGATALLQVQQIKADLYFMGTCAFDPAGGASAFDSEEAELKRAMVQASGQTALAITTEKLMSTAPYLIAPPSAIEYLMVEPGLPADWLADLQAHCGIVLEAKP